MSGHIHDEDECDLTADDLADLEQHTALAGVLAAAGVRLDYDHILCELRWEDAGTIYVAHAYWASRRSTPCWSTVLYRRLAHGAASLARSDIAEYEGLVEVAEFMIKCAKRAAEANPCAAG